jgi:sulfhydrogenase subunit beta (sulfur reductase)
MSGPRLILSGRMIRSSLSSDTVERDGLMSDIYISKESFPAAVKRLMAGYRVYGPVFQGLYHEFVELMAAEDADLGFSNTRLSPKGLFHPHSERMFQFSLAKDDPEAGILSETPKDFSDRIVLGIRPCDAKAFQLDDKNFDTSSYRDPWWVKRRESTILVGLACNDPCSTCFCTSMGTGPFDPSGLDVLLVDLGDGYSVQGITDKGEGVLGGMSEGNGLPGDAADRMKNLKKTAEASLGALSGVESIGRRDMNELFTASFWDEVQFACINCGTCTFVCPTCWCFDIQDEVYKDQGDRIRIWDSCMFPLFTFHGSGHNPRAQKLQRVRQRFMHKLKYFQDKYQSGAACVGCGRCVRACPVNIDIRRVMQLMSATCVCPA